MGLINQAVNADELDAAVERHVGKLLSVSAAAASYTKRAVNLPLRQAMHSVFDVSMAFEGLTMMQNADWKEGIAAFKERRAPRYNKS
jgi:enoyl-CoA hydratase